ARFTIGRDVDFDSRRHAIQRLDHVAGRFQDHGHFLVGLEVVVDVGREDHFVFLDKEPRRLEAHDQVLAGDDLGFAAADAGALAYAPDLDLPAGEVLG